MRSVPIHRQQTPVAPKHPLDPALEGVHGTLAAVVRRAHAITQAPFEVDATYSEARQLALTSDDLAAVDAAMQAAAREIGVRTLAVTLTGGAALYSL